MEKNKTMDQMAYKMPGQVKLQTEIEILKKDLALKEAELLALPKQTAKQWLEEFIQKGFDKVEINLDNKRTTYYRNRQWLFRLDKKNGWLWVCYTEIWEVLESKFKLKYEQTQSLVTDVVGEALNCTELTPYFHRY